MNHDSHTPESEFDDDRSIEISDLDAGEFPLSPLNRWLSKFFQAARRVGRARRGLAFYCVLALLLLGLLIAQVGWPWSASPSQPGGAALPAGTNVDASSLTLIATSQITYIQDPGRTITAYRATDGRILWQRQLGGCASADANEQMLYCLVALKDSAVLEALNGQNGRVVWSQQLTAAGEAPALLVESEQIYVSTRDGWLTAFRASDGKELWRYRDARGATLPLANFFTIEQNIAIIETPDGVNHLLRTSDGTEIMSYVGDGRLPLVEHGIIYLFLGFNSIDETDGTIQALRATDGARLWQTTLRVNQGWAPTESEGTVYADASNGAILALRGVDGRRLWSYQAQSPVSGTPAVQNGLLYALLQDGSVIALQASSGTLLWRTRISALAHLPGYTPLLEGSRIFLSALEPWGNVVYALRATDGRILWSHDMGSDNPLHTPVLFGSIFYLSQNDGSLDAWRASDGAHLWHYAPSFSSIDWIISDETGGTLYIKAFDNSIAVLRSSDGKLLWRYRPSDAEKTGPAS